MKFGYLIVKYNVQIRLLVVNTVSIDVTAICSVIMPKKRMNHLYIAIYHDYAT